MPAYEIYLLWPGKHFLGRRCGSKALHHAQTGSPGCRPKTRAAIVTLTRVHAQAHVPRLFFFFFFSSGSLAEEGVWARALSSNNFHPPRPPPPPLHASSWNLILMEMKSRRFGCPMACCISFHPGFPHRTTPCARHSWDVTKHQYFITQVSALCTSISFSLPYYSLNWENMPVAFVLKSVRKINIWLKINFQL